MCKKCSSNINQSNYQIGCFEVWQFPYGYYALTQAKDLSSLSFIIYGHGTNKKMSGLSFLRFFSLLIDKVHSLIASCYWGWGTQYKRLYGDVPPTGVIKSASWYTYEWPLQNAKIWYMNGSSLRNFPKFKPKLAQILEHFWKIGWFCLKLDPQIGQIGMRMGHLFWKNWYLYGSTFRSLLKPNLNTPGWSIISICVEIVVSVWIECMNLSPQSSILIFLCFFFVLFCFVFFLWFSKLTLFICHISSVIYDITSLIC